MSGRLVLVIGGSGSGKSAYAEKFLLAQAGGRAVYLAAMENTGDEAQQRIARHRAMRAAHGAAAGRTFVTIERPVGIGGADLLPGDAVLLEDLGNLLANELWSPGGAGKDAEGQILAGVRALLERAGLLVIVSSDVSGDGAAYDAETAAYIRQMGALHCALAQMAEQVVEVVCGLPVIRKAVTENETIRLSSTPKGNGARGLFDT
ncbi:MAG: bifunctional adenosylcobinamide kinase/adenosylcobinamide-phosphate guanylyltransferase [Oscillospiraceae bacterium]|nr:bifunctional adenosylcobinamide kinase/adenosylcobinamide-phosphate guanylyltransferase [Oscillospiraceae bacterium]